MKPVVCLNMIVKNEAHVIRRCLESVLPFIDAWAIADTGSTDGTQSLIREILGDLPGELIERPWVDFAYNRNEALQLAMKHGDYALLMDADNELITDTAAVTAASLESWEADAYSVEFLLGETRYQQKLLVRLDVGWQWRGVLHEALYADGEVDHRLLSGLTVMERREGARSLRPAAEKYADDVAILIKGLKHEPNNSRYVFYLAQSYRDSNQIERALRNYLRRAEMGGWDEEVWYSLHQAALLSERLDLDDDTIVGRYLRAYEFRPRRGEALMHLARFHRERNRWALAYLFAERAIATPRPDDALFVDESTYVWRSLDEYAIACYWTGRHRESATACKELLSSGHLPEEQRTRVTDNLSFNLQKLAATD